MSQYVVEAPDGSRHIIEGPDQAAPKPAGTDTGAAMAFGNSAVDMATFGLDRPVEAGIASLVYGAPYSKARQAVEDNANATQEAHPVARVAGDVVGGVGSMLTGGAAVEGARAIPGVARVADAVAQAPRLVKAAATAATDSAVGAGTGYVQGGKPGAVAGAIAGPVAGAAARGVLNTATPAAFKLLAKTVKMPGESLDQAATRLTNDFNEFKTRMGYPPALAQLVDVSQGKEIASTIGRRAGPSAMASDAEQTAAEKLQGGLAHAIATPRPTATAAQGDVEAAATKGLDKAMGQIDKQRVAVTPQQTQWLEANAKDLRSVMHGTSYDDARAALDDHLEQGTPPSVRDVETWRQAAARGAKSPDPVQAHNFQQVRNGVRTIGENVPEYKDAMDNYEQHMAFAENIPEGAKGTTAAPLDFQAGFRNQPATPAGAAAKAGQSVGLRTALSQKALQSPNAAAGLSRDITENAALRSNIATALPEAADTQRAGEMAYKAGRGMAAAVPVQRTQAQETAETTSQALRAGLLGVHGGSSSFMARVVEHAVNKFGLPLGTAKKVAQLAMDPANTPAVLQYLRARGTNATQRHEFMDLLRSGASAAAGNAAGTTQ